MTERPILFSGPMVRAILDGRKTQTRRVMKFQPATIMIDRYGRKHIQSDAERQRVIDTVLPRPVYPYGQPGDELWVRETFCPRSDLLLSKIQTPFYQASGDELPPGYRWKPSIHMSRWASRIQLRVTDVRVERVQGISLEDVCAEGIYEDNAGWHSETPAPTLGYISRMQCFAALWDSINAKRGFGWDANPWVWVVEFERACGDTNPRKEGR